MLKLRFRASASYKCPRHPRQQYGHDCEVPECDVCRSIADLAEAEHAFERAKLRAQQWVQRAALRAGGRR